MTDRMCKARFTALWLRLGAPGEWAGALFDDLHAHYASAQRHYHTPRHIDHCLARLDEVRELLRDPLAAELAIWFHDVIYELGADDNERRSAHYFLDVSRGHLDNLRRLRVARHILATIYPSNPRGEDARFIVDIDLSSFSLPWPQFLRDSVNVRRESVAGDDAGYAERQERFLTELRGTPPFFRTDYYRRRYEAQAQANIGRILALLGARRR